MAEAVRAAAIFGSMFRSHAERARAARSLWPGGGGPRPGDRPESVLPSVIDRPGIFEEKTGDPRR